MNDKVIVLDNFRIQKNRSHLKNVTSINRKSLYILIGIPGSGKSYYAQKHLKNDSTIIVSTDEIRREVYGSYKFSGDTNKEVIKIAKQKIEDGLICNLNIVFDATNTNKSYRKQIVSIGKKYETQMIAIVFQTSVSECINRNSLRSPERRVPNNIISSMAKFNSKIDKLNEGFDSVIYINS